MSFKQIFLAAGILAAVGLAGVLDTNDVKLSTTLGLGGNPAAIAVNKERKVELGTIALNKTSQSNQIKNTGAPLNTSLGISLFDGKDVNSSSFNDASKFLAYTGSYADNWFSLRYKYESNLYPNFKSSVEFTGPGAPFLQPYDPDRKARVSLYQKDAVETLSLLWARELSAGLTAGVELATNIYTLNTDISFNKAAKDIPPIWAIFEGIEKKAYLQSGSYYTLTLGGIYALADNQKISLAQKFSQDRAVQKHDGKYGSAQSSYLESLPNETGLSYIYSVNDSLEVAGVFKTFWGLIYDQNIQSSSAPETTETVRLFPYNSYGFAASYALNSELELQGYGNYIKGYKSGVNNSVHPLTGAKEDSSGYDVSQFGGNVQYSPALLRGGTILLGSYVTKLVSMDPAIGQTFDLTNTSLSYSHAF
ncbi:MAG: hypothetical protein LBQ83_06775 [Candidatus Margulisbacteria bacterium]|jgi:hypothetical protein|nr:hypothetical protein [Candidatus Margulisiibacteriota bacterium]